MNRLAPLLEAERGWLSHQAEFRDGWAEGTRWFNDLIEQSLGDYLPQFDSALPVEGLVEACRGRLCGCLLYHWNSAWEWGRRRVGLSAPPVSGTWIRKVLQSGNRPTTPSEVETSPRPLGGDPLRDQVLVENAVRYVHRALECLYREYRVIFESESQRIFGHGTAAAEWEDLVSRLVLSPGKPDSTDAPLAQYLGHSSLRSWLRPVCRNFLTDVWRGSRARRAAEQRFAEAHGRLATHLEGQRHESVDVEERATVRQIVLEAMAQLEARERGVLIWAFQCEMPNAAIAQSLGVSQGHASRLREKSLLRLQTFMRLAVLERFAGRPLEGWQSRLLELPTPSLGHLLQAVGAVPKQEETSPRSVHPMTERVTDTPYVPRRSPAEDLPQLPEPATAPHPVSMTPLSKEAFFSVLLNGQRWHTAEAVAEDLLGRAVLHRPSVVCLDARLVSEPRVISEWLDRFSAVLSDGDESESGEASAFYEPRRLVMASEEVVRHLCPDYLRYGDITWLPDPGQGEPYELYTRFLQQTFASAFVPPPSRSVPTGAGRSIEETLSEGERGEWRELMGQFDRWGKDQNIVS